MTQIKDSTPEDEPWSAEQLARARNDEAPPVDRRAMRRDRKLYFSGGSIPPEIIPTHDGWQINVPDDVMLGLPAVAMDDHSPPTSAQISGSNEIEAYRPADIPRAFHPSVLGSNLQHVSRRRNGSRIINHGIIFGGDDREIFDPGDYYPWCCAGRLTIWNDPNAMYWESDGAASAALVAPNIIVTSAHVIPKGTTKFRCLFQPGLYGSHSTLNKWSYVQTWRAYPVNGYDKGDDLAIMKLYEPIGNDLGWFGTKTYNDAWEDKAVFTRIGYAPIPAKGNADGRKPNRALNFPILDDDLSYGVELEYRSDASPGDSGGPVFAWFKGEPRIVGVHSGSQEEFDLGGLSHRGGITELNNVASGGQALVDLVKWGWKNWT